jgi:hypothetical protein
MDTFLALSSGDDSTTHETRTAPSDQFGQRISLVRRRSLGARKETLPTMTPPIRHGRSDTMEPMERFEPG